MGDGRRVRLFLFGLLALPCHATYGRMGSARNHADMLISSIWPAQARGGPGPAASRHRAQDLGRTPVPTGWPAWNVGGLEFVLFERPLWQPNGEA